MERRYKGRRHRLKRKSFEFLWGFLFQEQKHLRKPDGPPFIFQAKVSTKNSCSVSSKGMCREKREKIHILLKLYLLEKEKKRTEKKIIEMAGKTKLSIWNPLCSYFTFLQKDLIGRLVDQMGFLCHVSLLYII